MQMLSNGGLRVWWWSPRNRTSFWRNDSDLSATDNFGDLLGPFLVEELSGKHARFTPTDHPLRPIIYLVVGSVMAALRPNCVVWGPGIVTRDQSFSNADFRAVRGPLSYARLRELGYFCPPVFGDPAILLPSVFAPKPAKDFEYGIIPHYVDYSLVLRRFGSIPDVNVIDVRRPLREVITEICRCGRTISSSLHGIIVSHAYGVPSTWVEFSDMIFGDGTKFRDYLGSVGLNVEQPVKIGEEEDELGLIAILKQDSPMLLPRVDLDDLRRGLLATKPF
jgi:hypothetical protein